MMKKLITLVLFFTHCTLMYSQKYNGVFVGGMTYMDIYPKVVPIIQFNAGVSFEYRQILFDVVPIQVSYIDKKVYYGVSILYRKYIFKNKK